MSYNPISIAILYVLLEAGLFYLINRKVDFSFSETRWASLLIFIFIIGLILGVTL